ncbi:sensor histidine kinase, partial [Rhizobium leguminosarum]
SSRRAASASRDEALFALRTSTKQISRLASQLLTLSRAEPGSRRPRSDATDLTKAAREILEEHAEEALKRSIDVGLEAVRPVIVDGDATMLR